MTDRAEKLAAYFEQMYSGCWAKTKTAKSRNIPGLYQAKASRRKSPCLWGVLFVLHQKPNKTEAEQKPPFSLIRFSFAVLIYNRPAQPPAVHACAVSGCFLSPCQSLKGQKPETVKSSQIFHCQKVQYSLQYFMQYYQLKIKNNPCISGYYMLY